MPGGGVSCQDGPSGPETRLKSTSEGNTAEKPDEKPAAPGGGACPAVRSNW